MLHGLTLPFEGAAYVLWGGDTIDQNHHHDHPVQRYAFDFVSLPDAGLRRFFGNGSRNEDFLIFGRPILTPLDGVVVEAVDGIRDNRPRQMYERMPSGNYVLIRHSDCLFSHLSHLQQGSVAVRCGQTVARGEKIGLCGNSGRSTAPHLHFHVQSADRMANPVGLKCWFERVRVGDEIREDYSPVRGDNVENIG